MIKEGKENTVGRRRRGIEGLQRRKGGKDRKKVASKFVCSKIKLQIMQFS